jgi:peroxiredoxin
MSRNLKTLFVFFSIAFLFSCNSKKVEDATITGQLKNGANATIHFELITNTGDVAVDSTVADANGNFSLKNNASALDYYLLRTDNQNVAYLILKGGENISFTGDAKALERTYHVEGSPETKLLLELKCHEQNLSDSMNTQYAIIRAGNPAEKDIAGAALQRQYDSLLRDFAIRLIQNNFSSIVSLSASQYLDKQKDFDLLVQLDDSLKKALGDNKYVEVFSRQIEDMKKLPVGSAAPEINLKSPEGKLISLSSLKGKIVIIDFWASWCGPCRHDMPDMVSLYGDYKNKGLEIYGVSLDDNSDAWKSAIDHDGINWIQVSDLKKWESKAAVDYGVEEIPHTILLDKEGKIVARGLSPHELRIRIQELL